MKSLIIAIGAIALTGCSITQQHAQSMSPRNAYYCAVDGGINTAGGLWYQYDTHDYCRQRVAELEKSGQMLDVDKDGAMRAGAGL